MPRTRDSRNLPFESEKKVSTRPASLSSVKRISCAGSEPSGMKNWMDGGAPPAPPPRCAPAGPANSKRHRVASSIRRAWNFESIIHLLWVRLRSVNDRHGLIRPYHKSAAGGIGLRPRGQLTNESAGAKIKAHVR